MAVYDRLEAALIGAGARVVLPEMDDPRIAEAAAILADRGLAEVVPLGTDDARYVEAIRTQRPKTNEKMAARMLEREVTRGAAMVAVGEADAMVAGAATPTRRVIEAAGLTIGPAAGVETVSSFFLMSFPGGRELVFADCAVNVAPDAVALADIAVASAASAEALLGEARVALLSFSTLASGAGASVDKVNAALAALDGRLSAVGPVQADAALNVDVAAKKDIEGGDANTLIFPDLDAGNIAYKLCQELGGAQALGPFLQGFARPVCDLSRGARVDDIVKATVITLALARR